MRCNVSLPRGYGRSPATFAGLPPITKDDPLEIDLSETVMAALEGKGLKVEVLEAPEAGEPEEKEATPRRSTRSRRTRATRKADPPADPDPTITESKEE